MNVAGAFTCSVFLPVLVSVFLLPALVQKYRRVHIYTARTYTLYAKPREGRCPFWLKVLKHFIVYRYLSGPCNVNTAHCSGQNRTMWQRPEKLRAPTQLRGSWLTKQSGAGATGYIHSFSQSVICSRSIYPASTMCQGLDHVLGMPW